MSMIGKAAAFPFKMAGKALWGGTKLVGKGIGKAGMFGAEVVGGTTIGVAKGIGHFPAKNIMSNPGKFAAAVGIGAAGGALLADAVGEDPKDGAKAMGIGAFGAASVGGAGAVIAGGATMLGAAVGGAGVISKMGSSMIRMPDKAVTLDNLNDIKLNKKVALPLMAASMAIKGIFDAGKTYEKSRMGTNDGMLRSATPTVPVQQESRSPSYANNAGATGDLVFSMYNNR